MTCSRYIGPGLLWLCLLPACRADSDKKACSTALFEGRVLVKREELQEARQQLAVAVEKCAQKRQAYVEQLEEEIEAKQREIQKRQEREAEEEARRKRLPVKTFVSWVSRRRAAADKSEKDETCYERGHPRFGWCKAIKRLTKQTEFVTMYYRTDPEDYRFAVEVDAAVVCDDLGRHRVVRRWEAPDGTKRTHCEFLEKELRGLSALISGKDGQYRVDIFSRGFLDRDDEFRATVEREGR